ncbi:MAG TPA: hypothetical protein VIY71_10665 [Solirubrobacterales bacterium]
MKVSKGWAVLVGLVALASSLKVSHPAGGGFGIEFAVTVTTLGVIALLWLPSLLRAWSLAGGKLEAAGVAATSQGLLGSPEDLIDRLTGIKTTAEKVTEKVKDQAPEAAAALRSLDQEVDQMATEYLVGVDAVSASAIRALGRQYERLRAVMPPGDIRTIEMTRVVNEARVRAEADPQTAARWGPQLIRSEDQGRRIVGLAFLQAAPVAETFSDLLHLIRNSATAFEMFHTLLALRESAPLLTQSQRDQAAEALLDELEEDPRGVDIAADSALPALIREVAAELTSPAIV